MRVDEVLDLIVLLRLLLRDQVPEVHAGEQHQVVILQGTGTAMSMSRAKPVMSEVTVDGTGRDTALLR